MRTVVVVGVLCGFAAAACAEPTFEQINTACGAPLFADDNLWDDDASAVAGRLKLPEESRTSDQSSFRSYPAAEVRFLGARPLSKSLLADGGKPSGLSMVFANKGDSISYEAGALNNSEVPLRRADLRENRKAI
ncbi:MAG: hypothetical protein ACKOKC_12120 [Chthoniobacterales bacterium]